MKLTHRYGSVLGFGGLIAFVLGGLLLLLGAEPLINHPGRLFALTIGVIAILTVVHRELD
jgi:hypothetical protein